MEGKFFDGTCVRTTENGYETFSSASPESLPWVAPGLVDMQVNGFAGVDFNGETLTFDAYVHALRCSWEHHVTTILPTLVTNSVAFLTERLALLETYRQRALGMKGLAVAPFYHLEGPFISPTEGYRGAHPLEFVLETGRGDVETLLRTWQTAAGGRIKIVTFSPHGDKVPEFVRELASLGIRASVGHTDATAEQIHAAAESGATLATHLGNACAQLLPRHANPIWSILADERLWISMIPDGFHLPPDMLQVFYRVKREKALLVSDATQYTGQKPGSYQTHIGGNVVLTPEGKLHLAGQPNVLAGAAKSLYEGWCHLVELGFASKETLWKMASAHPLRFLTGEDFNVKYTPIIKI
ncbi:MAG: N-acetylglucosamine-6-phosphate deacetylase [Planctomycetia bacterium]|nr:N-acetylglucosamine-6-phosphate deacetylase [Planctomycetia bacterium]